MPLYFAYGSNMRRLRLERRIGDCRDLGWASLHHHEHGFAVLGHDGTGKGAVRPRAGVIVHGVLYELSRAQLNELRMIEDNYYAAEICCVAEPSIRGGNQVRAATFLPRRWSRRRLEPSAEYLSHYLEGMAEHGLPRDYVALIVRQAGD